MPQNTNCVTDLTFPCCTRTDELDCLTEIVAQCGCPVYPTWELFQETLDNATIITNLETDGNYTSVELLDKATEAQVLAVTGIGPASLAELQAAMGVYNLQINP